ncbi:TMEM175 family protein [Flavihumibacter profundi]|uniref:TMEM175 family protein n=1 Tax=Flavihumibacter profundi TaxID=2716883 RepID=UPI001CC66AAE|nr:TMEM175 family protein [Flavihumibacter profundi]MBZ5855515.1 TMEM175 family protein [Flavihumibacter profundi]
MKTSRTEAFSDGVLAIIITIMILEIKVPLGNTLKDLVPILPKFMTYLLSFIYVAIYWNNHHHLWQAVGNVNGKILWANLHLLFWLSLFPFTTGWMGENHFSTIPVALYGFILLMASIAWYILARIIIIEEGENSKIGRAYKKDTKTKVSMLLYATGVVMSFVQPIIGIIIYIIVAALWFIPDRRIENSLKNQ